MPGSSDRWTFSYSGQRRDPLIETIQEALPNSLTPRMFQPIGNKIAAQLNFIPE